MENTKKQMLSKKVWAVVGATPNTEKFGYKIFKKLQFKGYEVYAVNPNYDTIEGEKCYHAIKELPVKPDCVDMVVSPKVGKQFIEDIAQAEIQYVWFQPGTFDDEIIGQAQNKGLELVYHDCVLVALGGH